jgi:general secretion pathway protein L
MSTLIETPLRLWNGFIDAAARGATALAERVFPPTRLTIVEAADGRFFARPEGSKGEGTSLAIDAQGRVSFGDVKIGSSLRRANVDLVLGRQRFLSRDLPLPAQADDFLERILRMQIDRLTPWAADRAMFGYAVRERAADKIVVSLAAADRGMVQPIVEAIERLKPRELNTFAESESGSLIPLVRDRQEGVGKGKLRAALNGALIAMSLGLLGMAGWTAWEGAGLDEEYETLQRRIAGARAGLRAEDPAKAAERRILLRKARGPYVTVMLEELTRALPDETFLTDIELTGSKLRVTGVSRDASALIALIERSPGFADAGFFAPTTRGAGNAGDQFRIEATVRPGQSGKP